MIDFAVRRPPRVSLPPGEEVHPLPGSMVPRDVGIRSTVDQHRITNPDLGERPPDVRISNPQQAASVVSFPVNVPQSGVADSALVLEQPISQRNLLGFRNNSAAGNVFVSFGQRADILNSFIRLAPGDSILFDSVVPQDDVYVLADAAGCTVILAYSTYSPEF